MRALSAWGGERAKDGKKGSLGSGVFGGLGGEMISAACPSVDELIHFSSFEPIRGGEFSGIESNLNASAKWSLMNLSNHA